MTKQFKVLAQSMTSSQRISKTIEGETAAAVLKAVGKELDRAGYYAVSISEVGGRQGHGR